MTNATRFTGLGYRNMGRSLWRLVDIETDAVIGPFYATKTELLADLPRFVSEVWGE